MNGNNNLNCEAFQQKFDELPNKEEKLRFLEELLETIGVKASLNTPNLLNKIGSLQISEFLKNISFFVTEDVSDTENVISVRKKRKKSTEKRRKLKRISMEGVDWGKRVEEIQKERKKTQSQ